MKRSSVILIAKMRGTIEMIERVLHDPKLKADVQIDDVKTICWAMIQLTFELQRAIGEELYDLD